MRLFTDTEQKQRSCTSHPGGEELALMDATQMENGQSLTSLLGMYAKTLLSFNRICPSRIKYGEDKYPTSAPGLEWKRIFHQDAEKVEPGAGHGKRRRAGADGN